MKKLKETKLGQTLKRVAPQVLDFVGDVLPSSGALGVVKNILDKDENIDPATKQMLHDQLVETYKLEVADRDSARKREVDISKSGGNDWMMNLTGIVGLVCFIFIVYSVVYIPEVLHNELFVHLMGLIEGVVIGNIFAYYYGTSSKK